MSDTPQNRAVKNYRERLSGRGMARFEVLGLDADRKLVRSLARRLAKNDSKAERLRTMLRSAIPDEPPKKGGILSALLRSSFAGADFDLARPKLLGRKVEL
jgi:hypothetical protein